MKTLPQEKGAASSADFVLPSKADPSPRGKGGRALSERALTWGIGPRRYAGRKLPTADTDPIRKGPIT